MAKAMMMWQNDRTRSARTIELHIFFNFCNLSAIYNCDHTNGRMRTFVYFIECTFHIMN